jgi:hypothetical protein
VTTRYEIVRDGVDTRAPYHIVVRHPDQPADGFPTAMEAIFWCDSGDRALDGSWYIRPVEGSNG